MVRNEWQIVTRFKLNLPGSEFTLPERACRCRPRVSSEMYQHANYALPVERIHPWYEAALQGKGALHVIQASYIKIGHFTAGKRLSSAPGGFSSSSIGFASSQMWVR